MQPAYQFTVLPAFRTVPRSGACEKRESGSPLGAAFSFLRIRLLSFENRCPESDLPPVMLPDPMSVCPVQAATSDIGELHTADTVPPGSLGLAAAQAPDRNHGRQRTARESSSARVSGLEDTGRHATPRACSLASLNVHFILLIRPLYVGHSTAGLEGGIALFRRADKCNISWPE